MVRQAHVRASAQAPESSRRVCLPRSRTQHHDGIFSVRVLLPRGTSERSDLSRVEWHLKALVTTPRILSELRHPRPCAAAGRRPDAPALRRAQGRPALPRRSATRRRPSALWLARRRARTGRAARPRRHSAPDRLPARWRCCLAVKHGITGSQFILYRLFILVTRGPSDQLSHALKRASRAVRFGGEHADLKSRELAQRRVECTSSMSSVSEPAALQMATSVTSSSRSSSPSWLSTCERVARVDGSDGARARSGLEAPVTEVVLILSQP